MDEEKNNIPPEKENIPESKEKNIPVPYLSGFESNSHAARFLFVSVFLLLTVAGSAWGIYKYTDISSITGVCRSGPAT